MNLDFSSEKGIFLHIFISKYFLQQTKRIQKRIKMVLLM